MPELHWERSHPKVKTNHRTQALTLNVNPFSPDINLHILLNDLHGYISYGISNEHLIKYQVIFSLEVISFFLKTCTFDQVEILWGEVRCLSLWGLKQDWSMMGKICTCVWIFTLPQYITSVETTFAGTTQTIDTIETLKIGYEYDPNVSVLSRCTAARKGITCSDSYWDVVNYSIFNNGWKQTLGTCSVMKNHGCTYVCTDILKSLVHVSQCYVAKSQTTVSM